MVAWAPTSSSLNPTIPKLELDETAHLNCKEVVTLDICCFTKLSTLPFYSDSYFLIERQTPNYVITRRQLNPPPTQPPQFLENIIEQLMPEDSDFRVSDVMTIGKNALGLRHLSSDSQARKEVGTSHCNGCSLNISFGEAQEGSGKNKFENLHEKPPEEIEKMLPEYQKRIDQFIENSIEFHDLIEPEKGATFQDLLNSTETTRFLVVNYHEKSKPNDTSSWGTGLGRFPQWGVVIRKITLLKPLEVAQWKIPEGGREQYAFPFKKILSLLVAHYRKSLLDHLRNG